MWMLLASLLLVISGYVQASTSISDQTLSKASRKELQELLLRGQAFEEFGQFEAAISTFEAVIAQDEFSANAWRGLCWAQIQSGNWVKARPMCSRSFEFDVAEYFSNLALTSNGFLTAEPATPALQTAARLGHTYLLAGDEEGAVRWYREALVLMSADDVKKGPMAEFGKFIEKGWMKKRSEYWKSWFSESHKRRTTFSIKINEIFSNPNIESIGKLAMIRQNKIASLGPETWLDRLKFGLMEAHIYSQAGQGKEAISKLNSEKIKNGKERIAVLFYGYAIAQLQIDLQIWDEALISVENNISVSNEIFGENNDGFNLIKLQAASVYRDTGRLDEARTIYDFIINNSGQEIIKAYNDIGWFYFASNDLEKAIKYFDRGVTLSEKLYYIREDLAEIHRGLGRIYFILNDHEKAIFHNEKSLEEIQRVKKPKIHILARIKNDLATLYQEIGKYSESEFLFKDALDIRRRFFGDGHPVVSTAMNNLGLLYKIVGRYRDAELIFRQALIPDKTHPIYNSHLSDVLYEMGNYKEAEIYALQALQTREKELGVDHPDVAISLSSAARIYQKVGLYSQAEKMLIRALSIREESRGLKHLATATSMNNLATLLLDIGRYDDAELLLNRAIEVGRAFDGRALPTIAAFNKNIADVYFETGRYGKSEIYYRRAISEMEKVDKSHRKVASALNSLALAKIKKAEYFQAELILQQAIEIFQKSLGAEHPSVAASKINMADLYFLTGRATDAVELSRQAASIILLRNQDPVDLSVVQAALGKASENNGNSGAEVYWKKRSINQIQGLRERMGTMAVKSQISFLKRNEDHYQNLANALIKVGRFAEAQQVLAMLKEQELFDLTERSAASDPRITRLIYTEFEQSLNAELELLVESVSPSREERDALANKARNFTLDATETLRKDKLDAIVEQAGERLNAFFDQVDARFAQADEADRAQIRELNAQAVQPLQATLAKHRAQSGKSSVLLNYLVLGEEVQILVTTPTTQQRYAVAVKREELNQRIQSLRQAIQRRGPVETDAHQLYQWLIEPVSADLQAADAQVLMLALNDTLRYLPFAALHDGERWLIERYRLSVLTDAGQADLTSPPQPNWTVEAFGSSQAHGEFSALPHVVGELAGIERVRGQRTETWLDLEFTEARLTQAVSQQPPVLHIASHFAFRPGSERESQLLLGDGSLMSLQRLREYEFADLDLLVLSACETAMGGGREETGREVEGFAALAQRRGANAVLATLWKVADVSTAQLMERFYAIRAGAGTTKAEALRQAQLSLLNGEGLDEAIAATQAEAQGQRVALRGQRSATLLDALDDTPVSDPKRPYAHPFYWAPFVLMGNWL